MDSKIREFIQWFKSPKKISLSSWSSFLRPQARNLIALVILVLALPVTVFVAQQQQELRQRAQTSSGVPSSGVCELDCKKKNISCLDSVWNALSKCTENCLDDRSCLDQCSSTFKFEIDDCSKSKAACLVYCSAIKPTPGGDSCENYINQRQYCANKHGSGSDCRGGNAGPYGDGCSSPGPSCSDDNCNGENCNASGQVCSYNSSSPFADCSCKPKSQASPPPKRAYGTPGDGYATPPDESCPKSGDNCTYSESDGQCYSGHTDNKKKEGFNKGDCDYSCGPITCPSEKSKSNKPIIDCTPGEQVKSFDDLPCPKGKSGTCAGHSYCEYHSDGNRETDPICETASDTCYDKGSDPGRGGTSSSCQAEPKGDKITDKCLSCLTKDRKGLVSEIKNLNSELFSSCNNNEIVQFWCNNGISKDANEDCAQAKMSCGDSCGFKDEAKEKKKKREEKKKRDQTGNSRRKPKEKERPTATPKLTFSPSATTKPGGPSATPRPQEITPTLTPSPTPTPTPLPPLPAVKGLKADCGRTNDPQRPLGIEATWNIVSGTTTYAIRIDEDTPSWGGDFVNPGDTVENGVKETRFAREAKPLSSYRIWVHAVNQSSVYSEVTERLIVTCISLTPTPSKSGTGQTIGAGKIIILPKVTPASNAAAATPTTKP